MGSLITLVQQYGLWLVFFNVLALQAGLPLPAYPVLIVAGAYAAMGGNPLWELVVVGVAAALVADTGWYLAGRRFGVSILRVLCRVSLSPDGCVRQTEIDFRALRPDVDAVRQIRSRLRVGRDRDGRCGALALLAVRAVRRHRRCAVGGRRRRARLSFPQRHRRRDEHAQGTRPIRIDARGRAVLSPGC